MMEVKELYLLRHGDTGLQGRHIGSTDVPLIDEGKYQVSRTARILRSVGIERILCSPMLRCRQTLELLDISCPWQTNELLREIDFGRWEGKSFEEIAREDQELINDWVNKPDTFAFPGGESLAAFKKRVAAFKNMLEELDCRRILVVSHGGIIGHLLCLLLGIDIEKYLIFEVKTGSFCSIRLFAEGGVLTGFNIQG